MWNIFEYPFVGIGAAIFSMIALWILGAFWPEKKRKWHFAIPFVIMGLAFAIAYLVQTDKEKIQSAVNKGIKAFETQNIQLIREIIADDYRDTRHSSKELIVAHCQELFETATVDKITINSSQLEINDSNATFTMEVLVKFTENSRPAQMGKPMLFVKTRVKFEKTQDKNPTSPRLRRTRWLIVNSEILELDRNPVNWNYIRE
jgi:hypothetical protein